MDVSLKYYIESSKSYIDFFRLNVIPSNELYNKFINSLGPILDAKLDMTKTIKTDNHISGYSTLLEDLFSTLELKLQNLAKASIYKSLGYLTILTSTTDCSLHTNINLDIRNLDYKDLPPFSYGCKCTVEEDSFYEFC